MINRYIRKPIHHIGKNPAICISNICSSKALRYYFARSVRKLKLLPHL